MGSYKAEGKVLYDISGASFALWVTVCGSQEETLAEDAGSRNTHTLVYEWVSPGGLRLGMSTLQEASV